MMRYITVGLPQLDEASCRDARTAWQPGASDKKRSTMTSVLDFFPVSLCRVTERGARGLLFSILEHCWNRQSGDDARQCSHVLVESLSVGLGVAARHLEEEPDAAFGLV
jgi:hypothetical protein